MVKGQKLKLSIMSQQFSYFFVCDNWSAQLILYKLWAWIFCFPNAQLFDEYFPAIRYLYWTFTDIWFSYFTANQCPSDVLVSKVPSHPANGQDWWESWPATYGGHHIGHLCNIWSVTLLNILCNFMPAYDSWHAIIVLQTQKPAHYFVPLLAGPDQTVQLASSFS